MEMEWACHQELEKTFITSASMLAPLLDEIAAERPGAAKVAKLNLDEEQPVRRSAGNYSPSKYVNRSRREMLSLLPPNRTIALATMVRFTSRQGSSRNRRCRSVNPPSIRTSPVGPPGQLKCNVSARTTDSRQAALMKRSSVSGRMNRNDACDPDISIHAKSYPPTSTVSVGM